MKGKVSYLIMIFLVLILNPRVLLHGQGDSLFIVIDCYVNLDSSQVDRKNIDVLVKSDDMIYSFPPPSDRTEDQNFILIPDRLSADITLNRNAIDFTLFANGCYTKKITYTIDSALSTETRWYITSFYAESYTVQYPSVLCDYSEPVSPISDLPVKEITFSSANGLSIGSTGEIFPQKTTPGSYQIIMNSGYCLETNSIPISIIAKPDFKIIETLECDRTRLQLQINNVESPSVSWSDSTKGTVTEALESKPVWATVTDEFGCITTDSIMAEVKKLEISSPVIDKQESDCWVDGKVNIQSANVANNVGEYSYHLQNTINGSLVTQLEKVPEGEYVLQVIDSRDCMAVAPEKLTIIQKCLEDYPVFTPNSDGVEDQYFIPYQGKIKIYSSENHLVKELESPIYWDGTDQTGNSLPMGNYVMITDQGRPVNITIVR